MVKVYFVGQCPLAVGTGMHFLIALHLFLATCHYVNSCYSRSGLESVRMFSFSQQIINRIIYFSIVFVQCGMIRRSL